MGSHDLKTRAALSSVLHYARCVHLLRLCVRGYYGPELRPRDAARQSCRLVPLLGERCATRRYASRRELQTMRTNH